MTNSNNFSSSLSQFSASARSQPNASLSSLPAQKLEQLWNLPSTTRSRDVHAASQQSAGLLARIGQALLAFLIGDQSVRIWTSYGKMGVVWHAYDPVSDRYASRTSEDDLRIWLEKRHLS